MIVLFLIIVIYQQMQLSMVVLKLPLNVLWVVMPPQKKILKLKKTLLSKLEAWLNESICYC